MFKKIISTLVLTSAMLISNVAYSHSEHSNSSVEPPTTEQVITKATNDLIKLVDDKTAIEGQILKPSWKSVESKKMHYRSVRNYSISFTNTVESRTLYILLNAKGAYLDANFDGNFEQL
jgi:hypothetical protein